MTGWSSTEIWILIVAIGLGTFAIRFSFLGLLGGRTLPPGVLRHLRYTAVTVIPAMMAPVLIWPSDTGGATDPARLLAAAVTVAVGFVTRNLFAGLGAGALTFFAAAQVIGG